VGLIIETTTVGERFKKFRIQKSLSQAEVAEGICSFSTVSHLENNRNVPSPKILGKLAERLGVPLREIVGHEDSVYNPSFQLELIRVHIEMGDYEQGLTLVDKLSKNDTLLEYQERELLILRAQCLVKMEKFKEAIELLVPFLETQEIQPQVDDETLCDLYNLLGNAFYWSNDFEKAYSAYERGYKISLRLADFGIVAARVTKNLGIVCNQMGLKEDAHKYLEKAHVFFEKASEPKELANTLYYLALATGHVEHMVRARTVYEGLNMMREATIAKQYYVFHVEAKTDHKSALKKLEQIERDFEFLQDFDRCVFVLSRSAMICIDQGDFAQAQRYFERAEGYLTRLGSQRTFLCAEYYKAKAMFYLRHQDCDNCVKYSQIACEICDKMGLYAESAELYELIAESYSLQGETDAALQATKNAIKRLRYLTRGGSIL
jgi:transcriptional regulator with XRE-family HTH domain